MMDTTQFDGLHSFKFEIIIIILVGSGWILADILIRFHAWGCVLLVVLVAVTTAEPELMK